MLRNGCGINSSKCNPIEHRLFPHLKRACYEEILRTCKQWKRLITIHTVETVKHYRAKADTTNGLKLNVSILDIECETGRKCPSG